MNNRVGDWWRSFLAMPLWVKVWVFAILIPVNLATLLWLDQAGAVPVAVLAVSGLAFNAITLWVERAFSPTMAIPHVVFWVPLCGIVLGMLLGGDGPAPSADYRQFLWVLLVCDLVSLGFDVPDAARWVARRR